jgi:DnaK suppressor protein
MPRGKQQDQVEVAQAAPAANEQANGASARRTGAGGAKKAPATKSVGVKEVMKQDKERSLAAAAPLPARAATPGAQSEKTKPARAHRSEDAADRAGAVEAPTPEDEEAHRLFLAHQRELLMAERKNYTRQAEELRLQAEALALEHEPGDVQFDEEGGEGGTSNVDRELDLHLSAQAHAAVEEIDAALLKIDAGTYGLCESCGNAIPKARLEALPHARLCVSCKSGGLTARRQ